MLSTCTPACAAASSAALRARAAPARAGGGRPGRAAVDQQQRAAIDGRAGAGLRAVVDDGAVGARARDRREAGLHEARLRGAAAGEVLVDGHLGQRRARRDLRGRRRAPVQACMPPAPALTCGGVEMRGGVVVSCCAARRAVRGKP